MRDASTPGLCVSIIVCLQINVPPLLHAVARGHIDVVIALLKARANINAKNKVCLGLAGLRFDDSAGNADDISSITTIQAGDDAIVLARRFENHDVVSTIKQVFVTMFCNFAMTFSGTSVKHIFMFCNLRREC